MPAPATKDDAQRLIDSLPDEFQWDDLMKLIYERISIERGIEDIKAGRVVSTEELRRQFGLNR